MIKTGRNLHRGPQFNQQMMPRQSYDEIIPMSVFPGEPHSSNSQHDYYDRPNMVISGHRQLNSYHIGPRAHFEDNANQIVANMERNEELMEDTPISEQLRKETLRDLPQCLTMKRCVKMKLSKSIRSKTKRKPIGSWARLKYQISISFTNFKYSLNNFNYFKLWNSSLKNIEGRFGSGYGTYFKFFRWLFVVNVFVALLSFVLLIVPQILYDSNRTTNTTRGFQFEDLFTGTGFFYDSILYYSHYSNDWINVVPHLFYHVPTAYFCVTVALYLVSLVILSVSVAQSYRRCFIETEGGLQNVYANKIFCGWDYGIATKEAAELKSSAIYHELKELLSESLNEENERSCLRKFWTYSIQIVVNILVLILLFGVGFAIWNLLDKFASEASIVTTVVANIIMMVFPIIFNYISRYEDYMTPRTALYITLTRTFVLGCVIIGVILGFWLKKASDGTDCWENLLGAEIYRLILFDFFFSVVLTTLIEISYLGILQLSGKTPKAEFNISQHTLQIIYNQGLFWVGFLYSPLLPLLVTLKMLVIWYIREGYVRKFCRPPRKTWRAAQTQTYFMMLTFISILLIIAAHGYTLKSIPPSSCGPFRNYSRIYEIVILGVSDLEDDSIFWKIVMYLTKPGTITLIMIALGILVYYLKEQAAAQKEKVKMLREMVAWVAKDKEFLVQWYNEVSKGYNLDQVHEISDIFNRRSFATDDINSRFKKYS